MLAACPIQLWSVVAFTAQAASFTQQTLTDYNSAPMRPGMPHICCTSNGSSSAYSQRTKAEQGAHTCRPPHKSMPLCCCPNTPVRAGGTISRTRTHSTASWLQRNQPAKKKTHTTQAAEEWRTAMAVRLLPPAKHNNGSGDIVKRLLQRASMSWTCQMGSRPSKHQPQCCCSATEAPIQGRF